MKIDRQIGILSILLQRDTVTSPYLAERFEVSRRTINRDIEDLCKAGIPIVTRQGGGGSISIMENYKVDRTVFTTAEMQDILAGLRSLDSVHGANRSGRAAGDHREYAKKLFFRRRRMPLPHLRHLACFTRENL